MEPIKELMPFSSADGQESVCRVEIILLKDGRHAVICEELDDNPGKSITDQWEAVALKVCQKYNVPAKGTVWIEHYSTTLKTAAGVSSRWQLVTFKLPKVGEGDVEWRDMTPDDWIELGLPIRE